MTIDRVLLAVLATGIWALVLKPDAPQADNVVVTGGEPRLALTPGAAQTSDAVLYSPTGGSLTAAIRSRVMQFPSRAALRDYLQAMPAAAHGNGDLFMVGHLMWRWSEGAAEISDLDNLVPEGLTVSTDHFPSEDEAYDWAVTRNIYVQQAGNPGHFQIGRLGGGGFNRSHADGALSFNLKVTDSSNAVPGGRGPQKTRAITGQLILDDPQARGGHAAGYFSTTVRNGVDYPARVGGLGSWSTAKILGVTNGKAWGSYASAQFAQTNRGAESDGKLIGIEIGAKNWGGSDVDDPYGDKAKIGIWFAQGGDADAVDHQPSTAMIVNGNERKTGWHYGLVWRNVAKDYLWLHQPIRGAQARAMRISNSPDWADEVIVLPYGSGIGIYRRDGRVIDGVLNGDRLKVGQGVYVAGQQVLAARQPAIRDSAGGDERARINAILSALRAHGIIAR